MADQPEQSDKTEDPTERKLREARRKGDVPVSKEVAGLFILSAAAMLAAVYAPAGAAVLARPMAGLVEHAYAISASGSGDVSAAMYMAVMTVLFAMAPVLVGVVIAAVAAALAQNAAVFAPSRLAPKGDRISIQKGLGRTFGPDAFMEFLKGLIKIAAAGGAAVMVIRGELDRLGQAAAVEIADAPALLAAAALKVLLAVLVVTAVVAAVDVLWRRSRWMSQQRMTRRELKDEMKNTEGDPQVKAKLDSIRRDRARRRMVQAVPTASVVIANPTHYAVALRYAPGETPAPVCVAKGADLLALTIRETAEDAGVPVVEEPPTARALYAAVDVDHTIPPDLFLAVAEILTRIQRAEGRLGAA